MTNYRILAVASFLASAAALPLNINLGAYSPALVVGDGEISFGGGQDVTSLMNALEGAAVNGAAARNGAGNGDGENAQSVKVAPTPVPAEHTVAVKGSETTAAAVPAAPEPTPEPAPPAEDPAEDPALQAQAVQISGLQGMGKQIAPREKEELPKAAKRDLQGFDRALLFAESALTKGPLIQLGTGEGGAGVGIIVDNRPNAAAPAAPPAEKRDEATQPRRRAKVTRMYVKRGIPSGIQSSSELDARSVQPLADLDLPAILKRDNSEAIDAINLNIPGDEGVTMTFVETSDDDEDEA